MFEPVPHARIIYKRVLSLPIPRSDVPQLFGRQNVNGLLCLASNIPTGQSVVDETVAAAQ